MSPIGALVRLTLLLGLLLQLCQASGPHAAGLTLPGLRKQDTAARVCRSFKVCHNSKGAAWTTVQLFSALEPLLRTLKLEPATEYVEVTPLQGCLTSGCCCSTPVEVRFSLPVHKDKRTAADELAAVSDFLQFKLPRELQGTACTSNQLGDCPPALAAERKLLRNGPEEDDSLPPLPEGLIPYDGKKPAPEIEEEPKPQQPTKPQPKPQKQPQSAKPQPAAAAAKTPVDDPALDPVLPEGLIPYDHRTTRQLLEEEDSDIGGVLAVAAVPAMPAGIGAMAAAVLESGSLGSSSSDATTPGAYGSGASSHGRSLLETPGGYGGGRSLLGMDDVTVGGYGGRSLLGMDGAEGSVGGYGGRSLLGEQQQPDKKKQEQQAAAPKKQDKAAAKPSTPPKADHKRPSPPPVSATTTAAAKTTSSPPAPCSAASNGTSSSLAANGRPFSTCYCRYNTKDSSWALEQAACRAALFSRCQSAGPLLECSQVDAFYRGLSMPGSEEIPHKEALETFLYTDCPPAPPCSCRGLLTGSETPTARSRCCADLQAHCQVPFSGLDCEDVGRFCRAGRQTSDPVGALFSWVLVKTQGFDCGSPKYAVSYTSVVSASSGARSIGADDAIRQLSKAAMFEGLTRYDYSETDRMAALLTMLIGGCFAVAVAAVGVGVIFRIVSTRNHHSAPLLERL